jgi:hypothetical protein
MKIESLDDLEAVMRLCHRMKVHTIVVDGVTLQLSPVDIDAKEEKDDPGPPIDPMTGFPMTPEEIQYYSNLGKGN